jgi:Pyruvate/2-oxoglutarate dehydrogenase complex, dehydrogenase (E1) component, eukaryotic type, alpha subunit
MSTTPTLEQHLEMYRRMIVTRRLEERIGELHKAGKTRGPIHRCDGQEAVGVGATAALREDDHVTSTHRGHAHYIGKGLDPHRVMAEIMGRSTGYCGGRAGHMLIADATQGMLGGNAIVGASIPAATGMALSFQVLKSSRIALCFFGDGAAQTGICHESMNIAALWKLPVVFMLEHNEYGLTVHHTAQSPVADLSTRAAGYGMPSEIVDGNNAVAVYEAVARAAERARRGEGPSLIEAKTYRVEGFSTSDMGGYQDPHVIAQWKERDPILVSHALLKDDAGEARLQHIKDDAIQEVDRAIEQALADPLPEFELFAPSAAYSEVK